jgi:RNA polymerase sigma-70 factor (ECF subfamily)
MGPNGDGENDALREIRAYLETLTYIQVHPRLWRKFGMSDIVQNTLMKAWRDLERIQGLDDAGRKRFLRRMLLNNLIDEIRRIPPGLREQSLDDALNESSSRLGDALAAEDTSPSEQAAKRETALQLLEAISKLNERERVALILQRYHGQKLAEIAEHLGCNANAVAGLHARGLKKLRQMVPELE